MGPAGNADLPGNVGPDLSEIGNAGREDEWLFNYVYDARVYNPETVMPPWGTHGLFNEAGNPRHRRVPQDAEIAGANSATALDDPEKRPPPVEKRDNLDPLENPGMWAVEKAQELWKQRKAPTGFSCTTCHNAPATQFKTWAARMPKWEPRLDKVLGVEEFVDAPCQGDDRRRLADGDRRQHARCRSICISSPTASRSRSIPRARRRRRRSSAARN